MGGTGTEYKFNVGIFIDQKNNKEYIQKELEDFE